MFTGLIEEVGWVREIRTEGDLVRLRIAGPETAAGLAIGDSVSVDGACLTVTRLQGRWFEVELSAETLTRTTLGGLAPSDPVNLERPCRPTDRLGGHIVTGHVDGVGTILDIQQVGGMWRFSFRYPEVLRPLLVEKGSIAVDGISLTIAGLRDAAFDVAVVPYTYSHTTLGKKGVGRRVNLEADLIGKYVIRYLDQLALARRTGSQGQAIPRAPDAVLAEPEELT
jgi:riboflavin synthase